MAARQREKGMLNILRNPSGRSRLMALDTIGGVSGLLMVGFFGSQVIVTMAIQTLNAQRFKPPRGTRFMAKLAVSQLMGSGKRKAAQPVDIQNVLYNPGIRGMAPGAIRT
jgi:hypothetical protein